MRFFKGYVKGLIGRALFNLKILGLIKIFVNGYKANANDQGQFVFPYITKRVNNNFQILTYHRVNDEEDLFFGGMPINIFSLQMEYASTHYHVLSLVEAVERMERRDLPENALVVTFDDGYKDNYQHAFPVMRKFSIPATIFLVTQPIEDSKMLWHDRVFSAFRQTSNTALSSYGKDAQTFSLHTIREKKLAQNHVLNFLRSLDDEERSLWVERLIEKLGVEITEDVQSLMLNWVEVREMNREGISFGAHTLSHPILSKLSLERAKQEICESKSLIEKKIQTPVHTFAYPNGRNEDFNESTKQILKDCGIMCAVTTVFGSNEKGCDLLELRRGGAWEYSLSSFAMKMNWYKFRH